jgi:hypothetical protein
MPGIRLNGVLGIKHDEQSKKRRHRDEKDAHPVHAKIITDPDARKRPEPLHKLHVGGADPKTVREEGREDERQGRSHKPDPVREAVVLYESQRHSERHRKEKQNAQYREPDLLHGRYLV